MRFSASTGEYLGNMIDDDHAIGLADHLLTSSSELWVSGEFTNNVARYGAHSAAYLGQITQGISVPQFLVEMPNHRWLLSTGGSWHGASGHWSAIGVPDAGSHVIFDLPGVAYTVTLDGDAAAKDLKVYAGAPTIDLDGATLTLGRGLKVGRVIDSAAVTFTGGTLLSAGLPETAGTADVIGAPGAAGATLNLDGGEGGLMHWRSDANQVRLDGAGRLAIYNGATFHHAGSQGVRIGGASGGGTAVMMLDGEGTAATIDQALWVGFESAGQVEIYSGAAVEAGAVNVATFSAAAGHVRVTGGEGTPGTLRVTNGGSLILGGGAGGFGTLAVEHGGLVDVTGTTRVNNGRIDLAGGTLRTRTLDLQNSIARLNWTGGTLELAGQSSAAASVVGLNDWLEVPVAGELTGRFATVQGNVRNRGTISITPADGSNPVSTLRINGGLTQTATGELRFRLGDTRLEQLSIGGAFNIQGGTLIVELLDGYHPLPGDNFQLWEAANTFGGFTTRLLPDLHPGLSWNTSFLNSLGSIAVAGTLTLLTGDANNDGVVDALDFLAVESNFGAVGAANGLLPGDANDDGRVDGADWLWVERHFGATLDGLATPEPGTGAAAVLGGGGAALSRGRRRAA